MESSDSSGSTSLASCRPRTVSPRAGGSQPITCCPQRCSLEDVRKITQYSKSRISASASVASRRGCPPKSREIRASSRLTWGPMMLELINVNAYYGRIQALKGISLRVDEGKIVSLLGANGAGKTTTVRTIVGLNRSTANDIRFEGRPIGRIQPHKIVRLGIAMVPERRELFPDMKVIDNLEMGAYSRANADELRRDLDWTYSLFPVLAERRKNRAGALSGGQQQMLAIGRALMSHPRLLLLDEPTLGLAPLIVKQIFATLQKLNQDGMTILLIEQNANQALKLSEYSYILENGQIALEGKSAVLSADPTVQRSYLGAT